MIHCSVCSQGGGLYIDGNGNVNITRTLISGNTAYEHGGGIYVADGAAPPTLDGFSSVLNNAPDGCFGFWSAACGKSLVAGPAAA